MKRILVIEDDTHVQALIQKVLERADYEVIAASDGAEGLKLYRENPADLVITDLIMPHKEGLETIMEFRRDYPDVKIIAISGGGRLDPESYLETAKQMGAAYTFAKPFENQELVAAVQELLKQ
jgi:DNA-binding response OmpR family regulator